MFLAADSKLQLLYPMFFSVLALKQLDRRAIGLTAHPRRVFPSAVLTTPRAHAVTIATTVPRQAIALPVRSTITTERHVRT